MRIAVATDERTGVADAVVEELRKRGHDPLVHGALSEGERDDWAWASEAAARDVAEGRTEQAIVCCWTGTGASIAANKVPGVRAALVWNRDTAELARQHNDANVVSIGARQHSVEEATELVLLFLRTDFSGDERHIRRIGLISDYERDRHRPAGGLPTRTEA